jgi:hypothetical protein
MRPGAPSTQPGRRTSWTSLYRLALLFLPARLRRKHGRAMESLFTSELERARVRGRLFGALAGAAGVWDVVLRGAYERVRTVLDSLPVPGDDQRRRSSSINPPGQLLAGTNFGAQSMTTPATREILCRHASAFGVSFAVLTAVLLTNSVSQHLPWLWARGDSVGTLVEFVLLSLPHTAALTIPMAVLIAVLWVFTRLGAEGALAEARLERGGVRRLVVPVLGAAAAIGALTLVLNAEILPRANGRLVAVIVGFTPERRSDRAMTIAELRAGAQRTSADSGTRPLARPAAYEIEIQKKYALAAAPIILALAGIAIALRFPRGGVGLVIVASFTVFATYWICLVAGETLGDRQTVSPFVAMWTANGLLLTAALIAMQGNRPPLATDGIGPFAIDG